MRSARGAQRSLWLCRLLLEAPSPRGRPLSPTRLLASDKRLSFVASLLQRACARCVQPSLR
jgi:hypothetical protein